MIPHQGKKLLSPNSTKLLGHRIMSSYRIAVSTPKIERGCLGSAVLRPRPHYRKMEALPGALQGPWSPTTCRPWPDSGIGMINQSSDSPQPWLLLSANLPPGLTGMPQECKLITDFRPRGSKCRLLIVLFLRAPEGKHLLLLRLVPLGAAASA